MGNIKAKAIQNKFKFFLDACFITGAGKTGIDAVLRLLDLGVNQVTYHSSILVPIKLSCIELERDL